jgi:signal peptidase I
MENEILDYCLKEMNNVDSNATTFKNGIAKIAEKYGFTNIDVTINSQFGKDNIPMIVNVQGTSMYPTLKDGEDVIIEKTNDIKVGDIVVAKDPQYGLLIKRVGNISGDQIFLSADNNDTVTIYENGRYYQMIAVEKWTNASNIVGVARIFDINEINSNNKNNNNFFFIKENIKELVFA